jgi:hypothetical protein
MFDEEREKRYQDELKSIEAKEATRRILRSPNNKPHDRSDVRRLEIGQKAAGKDEYNQRLDWLKAREGRSVFVMADGVQEEWMVIGPKLSWVGEGQVLMAVVNKRINGKVSSFEMPVEELQKKYPG